MRWAKVASDVQICRNSGANFQKWCKDQVKSKKLQLEDFTTATANEES